MPSRAAAHLAEAIELRADLQRLLPDLVADPELRRDVALLEGYRASLERLDHGDDEHRRYLADSLRYAGWLKLGTPRA